MLRLGHNVSFAFPTERELKCRGGRKFHPHVAAWRGNQVRKRNFTMLLPQPEFLSKLHLTILEIEGIVFNIVLFCKFVLTEIVNIILGIIRQCQKR